MGQSNESDTVSKRSSQHTVTIIAALDMDMQQICVLTCNKLSSQIAATRVVFLQCISCYGRFSNLMWTLLLLVQSAALALTAPSCLLLLARLLHLLLLLSRLLNMQFSLSSKTASSLHCCGRCRLISTLPRVPRVVIIHFSLGSCWRVHSIASPRVALPVHSCTASTAISVRSATNVYKIMLKQF